MIVVALALAGCAQSPSPSAAPAPAAELEDALAARLRDAPEADVMVGLTYPSASPQDRAGWRRQVAQAQDAALACAGLDQTAVTRRYTNIPSLQMRLDPAGAQALARCPTVELLSLNHAVVPHLSQSLPLIGATTARVASGMDGAGTIVAILDTGVDWTQAELGGCIGDGCKVLSGYDFADGDDDPSDCHGHGTNVSAIAAGTSGVAPGASILPYKVFGGADCAVSDDATLSAALDAVLSAADTLPIAAVNMSLGYSGYAATEACDRVAMSMRTSVRAVYDRGIPLIVSAGNDGYAGAVSYPACLSRVLAVANAYDADVGGGVYCTDAWCSGTCTDDRSAADQIQCTSNGGALIGVAAPGTFITAGGLTMAGTSQAAPHVTGAAALLREAVPDASPEQIYRWLARGDAAVEDARSGVTFRYPRLDLGAALSADAADLGVAGGGASDQGEGTDGDGDGVIERGETVAIDLSIANLGPGDLDSATVTLSSDVAWAELLDGTAALGRVRYADTAPLADSSYDFLLRIDEGCAEDGPLTLTVSFSDDSDAHAEQSWTLPVVCSEEIPDSGPGVEDTSISNDSISNDTSTDSGAPAADPTSGAQPDEGGSDGGCGCASAGAPSGWAGAALLLAALRRRRQTSAVSATSGGAR